jgi:hypothetical protein
MNAKRKKICLCSGTMPSPQSTQNYYIMYQHFRLEYFSNLWKKASPPPPPPPKRPLRTSVHCVSCDCDIKKTNFQKTRSDDENCILLVQIQVSVSMVLKIPGCVKTKFIEFVSNTSSWTRTILSNGAFISVQRITLRDLKRHASSLPEILTTHERGGIPVLNYTS